LLDIDAKELREAMDGTIKFSLVCHIIKLATDKVEVIEACSKETPQGLLNIKFAIFPHILPIMT